MSTNNNDNSLSSTSSEEVESIINEVLKYTTTNRGKILFDYDTDSQVLDACEAIGDTRRPLVLFRGKPIIREQTMKLITGEEPLFVEADNDNCFFDVGSKRNPLNDIFYRPGDIWLDTWLHTDGTIGGNTFSLKKYPEHYEFIPEYMRLSQYEFLDMVISYTTCDAICCRDCYLNLDHLKVFTEEFFKNKTINCNDCVKYKDKLIEYANIEWEQIRSFEDLYFKNWTSSHVPANIDKKVELTIWFHNGNAEVLFGEAARKKFKEYNSLYSSPEYDFMFSSKLHDYDYTCICDKSFVEDCFEYIGKPRTLCDEYIEKGFISPFNENAIVVTKEWVTEQYNKYIKPLTSSHNCKKK